MYLEIIKDISIILASLTAIYGINSWRREYVGRRRLELAEKTLAMFYEATDTIRHMRSPLGFVEENENFEKKLGETDDQYQARKQASVVFTRYNNNRELFNRLHSMRYQFISLYGRDAAKPFDDLHGIIHKIFSAARMLAVLWAREPIGDEARQGHFNKIEEYEAIFWELTGESDPINPEVERILNDIEKICRNIIEGNRSHPKFMSKVHSRVKKILENRSVG